MAKRPRARRSVVESLDNFIDCPLHDDGAAHDVEVVFDAQTNNWAQERPLQVVRCVEDGLVFFSPNIKPETRRAYHGKEYYVQDAKGCIGYPDYLEADHVAAKIYFGKLILSWFQRLWPNKARKPSSLIDFGCATGHMGIPFKEKGWDVVGIEFSEWAVMWGRENLGLDLRCQDMDELELGEEEWFDCILFWDSLEHAQKPRELLRKMHQHSPDDALMILQMPDVNHYIKDPQHPFWSLYQHCFHYTPETLKLMLEMEGWKVLRKLPSSQEGEMLIVSVKG